MELVAILAGDEATLADILAGNVVAILAGNEATLANILVGNVVGN